MKHIQNIGPHLSELIEFGREIGDGFEIGDIEKGAQLLCEDDGAHHGTKSKSRNNEVKLVKFAKQHK